MRKRERVENERGLFRLGEEIEAFANATGTLARIEAYLCVMKRYRAVIARACGVRSDSQQLAKDVYCRLHLIAKVDLWMEMWRAECALAAGTKPRQTEAILDEFPWYVDEMRRTYPLIRDYVAAQEARDKEWAARWCASASHTEPRDPGRRGPRIDLSIEQIEGDEIDGTERGLSLTVRDLRLAAATSLKEAMSTLPGVMGVKMNRTRGFRSEIKYSIRTRLTTEHLARVLTNGLRGMAFHIIAMNEKTIEVAKR